MLKAILKKILPGFIRKNIRNIFAAEIKKERAEILKNIPHFDLQEIHIKNLRVLPNRLNLLEVLPKQGIVAEIGVNKGAYSKEIIFRTAPKKLHLIDAWDTDRFHDGIQKLVENTFKDEIESGVVEINRGYSTKVGSQFPDGYFDWIYLDTDHSYKLTKNELVLYADKMKPGGVIAGHDFVMGNWRDGIRYGVMEAVYEFCVLYDWELIYLTIESTNSSSFAIRKIGN
jgi:predicted O-methyltransferase YrrM